MRDSSVAFIGIGAMGTGIAKSLLRQGFDLRVFDTDPNRGRAIGHLENVVVANSAAEAAEGADIAAAILPLPESLREAVSGSHGLIHGLEAGSLFVQMSSVDSATTLEIAACVKEIDVEMVDSPVLRGPDEAERGDLAVLVAGDPASVDRARPFHEAISHKIIYAGELGQASSLKAINNTLNLTIKAAAAEALSAGAASGHQLDAMLEVFEQTAAWNRHLDLVKAAGDAYEGFEVTMRSELTIKDMRHGVLQAARVHSPSPVLAAAYNSLCQAANLIPAESLEDPFLKSLSQASGCKIE